MVISETTTENDTKQEGVQDYPCSPLSRVRNKLEREKFMHTAEWTSLGDLSLATLCPASRVNSLIVDTRKPVNFRV